MNRDWTRFIHASVLKHFDALKQGQYLYVPGQHPATKGQSSWMEIQLTGPSFKEQTTGQFNVLLGVHISCNAKVESPNIYLVHQIAGIAQEAMLDIPVYKYNTDPDENDDPDYFFCLQRIEDVDTIPWGIVNKDVDVQVISVDAQYKGEFIWP